MKDKLEERINQLQSAIEQSAANHNALLGRINEAKDILDLLSKKEEASNDVIDVAVSE